MSMRRKSIVKGNLEPAASADPKICGGVITRAGRLVQENGGGRQIDFPSKNQLEIFQRDRALTRASRYAVHRCDLRSDPLLGVPDAASQRTDLEWFGSHPYRRSP